MFVWQHLALSIGLGLLIYFLTGEVRPLFWLCVAQAVDLDHFSGSFVNLLVGGGAWRLDQLVGLHRGLFHDPYFFVPVWLFLVGYFIFSGDMDAYWLFIGWWVHILADIPL